MSDLQVTPIDIQASFEDTPAPLDFVLPGLLAGTVGSIVAPGASGKSFLALQIAVAVAAGQDITDGVLTAHDQATGRVVYLPAEDPREVIQHRLHSIGAHLPPSVREAVAERVTILPLLGHMPHLLGPRGDITRTTQRWYKELRTVAQDTRLLLLDTVRRFHACDENDGAAMAVLIQLLERIAVDTGTTIIFCHHTNKAATAAGSGAEPTASRGSSVLTDNLRWQINLTTMTEKQAGGLGVDESERRNFLQVHGAKINYAAARTGRWLRRAEGGVLVPAVFDPPGRVEQARARASVSVLSRGQSAKAAAHDDWE